jgi:RNA polymerase sigma-70 factor (ECF subfamily)
MSHGKRSSPHTTEGWRTFEEVVTQHLDALFRTALRLTRGHTANAEDLLQDSMLRACEGYDELRDPGAARTWLYTILMRTHFNRQRSAKRHPEALASDLSDTEFEKALADWPGIHVAHGAANDSPSLEDVAAAIDALHESLRAVVVLVDVQGFRQREVATMLDLPEGTVASRLFRARRLLRDALTDASSTVTRPSHGSQ